MNVYNADQRISNSKIMMIMMMMMMMMMMIIIIIIIIITSIGPSAVHLRELFLHTINEK
jgi:hypothetical protein